MSNKTKVSNVDLNPSIQIDEIVYQKIMHWIGKAGSYEVSGLGNVIYDKANKCFKVTEAWLLKQENSGVTTDIDNAAVGKLMFEHHKSNIEGDLRFWWHSHASMGVFWSGTDKDTIKELGEGGWFLSTVFNNKEEMRTCLYMTDPMSVFVDELDTAIVSNISDEEIAEALSDLGLKIRKDKEQNLRWLLDLEVDEETIESWDNEYDEKVKEKKYVPTYSGHRGYEGYGGYGGQSNYSGYDPITGIYTPSASLSKKREYFPDFNPPKNKGVYPAWNDSCILNPQDQDDPFTAHLMEEIETFRLDMDDEEIIDLYEHEYPNIKEILKYIDDRDEEVNV